MRAGPREGAHSGVRCDRDGQGRPCTPGAAGPGRAGEGQGQRGGWRGGRAVRNLHGAAGDAGQGEIDLFLWAVLRITA